MYPRPKLEKASLEVIDSKDPKFKPKNPLVDKKKLEFQFNPKELSLSRSLDVTAGEREGDSYLAPIKVNGKSSIDELSFECIFDQSALSVSHPLTIATSFLPVTKAEVPATLVPASFLPAALRAPSVQDAVTTLYAWTMVVDVKDIKNNRPYFVRFKWQDFYFSGAIAKLDIKYTLFDSDGTPLRAKVDITLKGRKANVTDVAKLQEKASSTASANLNG